jgi:ligand-binding SRPBCC domain-containing protein
MVNFSKHSGIYTLEVKQKLPISSEEAWNFFTSPENLSKITPPHMGFQITSHNLSKVYAGQIISYKVSLIPGIKTNWVTEITQVKESEYFIDEQRFGPYTMWHHEHLFKPDKEDVLMLDRISYKLPLGFLGGLAHAIFVKKQLKNIFSYRKEVLDKMFPSKVTELEYSNES